MTPHARYFGKYRGTCLGSDDPEQRGRILVEVPGLGGVRVSGWAMPCVPYAGHAAGFVALPEDGSQVWVEFERGDPAHPIWVGAFWGPGELPTASGLGPGDLLIRTAAGASVAVSAGSIVISTAEGASITLAGERVQIVSEP